MAKFTSKNIEFLDGQKAIFGTDDDAYFMWDDLGNQMIVSTVISGVTPTQPGHLTPKWYVDQAVTSGIGVIDHGTLTGLGDDDHPAYVPRDGSRGFTSTVSGIYPVELSDLTTKEYVDTVASGRDEFIELIDTPSAYDVVDYTSPQYVRIKDDGSGLEFAPAIVGTTSSGVNPPEDSNLWYNTTYNEFFYYDPGRDEWLSMNVHNYLYTYQGAIDGLYMSIGNVSHSDAHFLIPRPAIITAIIVSAEDKGATSKTFQIQDGNNGNAIIYSFNTTNYAYQDMAASINVDADTKMKMYITNVGLAARNPIATIEVRWRYEII